MKEKQQIVLVRRRRSSPLFSIEEIAARCGVGCSFIERLYRSGIIDPYPGSDRLFAPAVTLRVRKVCRLQDDLGINPEGAAIILDLVGRVQALEEHLRRLERNS
jgi:DNA-binding transcriptional MerR regulator